MATLSLPIQRLEQQAAVRISSSHFVPRPTRSTPYLPLLQSCGELDLLVCN